MASVSGHRPWKEVKVARQLSRRRTEPVNPEPPDDDDTEEYDSEDNEPGSGSSRRRTARPSATRDSGTRRRRTSDSGDDDDDDSRSGRERKRKREPAATREPSRGWDQYKKAKAKSSRWNDEDKFTVEEGEEELIVFLEGEPFATWNEHFIRELDGKKSWVCLDEDCPLCERGDSPGYRAAFNVAAFDDKGNPVIKYWIATPGPLDEIEEHAFNERYGPLDRDGNYFVVSKKKGKNKFFKYKVERVTEDQVQEEFGFDPLTEAEVTDLAANGFGEKDVYTVSSRKELRDVARELDD
jgi:hypothetical protein